MSTLITVHRKGQVTIPSSLRTQAGLSEGDMIEATFHNGKIVFTPKVVIDRKHHLKKAKAKRTRGSSS